MSKPVVIFLNPEEIAALSKLCGVILDEPRGREIVETFYDEDSLDGLKSAWDKLDQKLREIYGED